MIDIIVRRISIYKEVTIVFGNQSFQTGLLDEKEALEVSREFKDAAEELGPEFSEDAARACDVALNEILNICNKAIKENE